TAQTHGARLLLPGELRLQQIDRYLFADCRQFRWRHRAAAESALPELRARPVRLGPWPQPYHHVHVRSAVGASGIATELADLRYGQDADRPAVHRVGNECTARSG